MDLDLDLDLDSSPLKSSSSARKLPIKRPPPPPPPPPSTATDPNHSSSSFPEADDDDDPEDDYDTNDNNNELAAVSSADAATPRHPPPPFKFQRIWSESDEIRFLQGLLACKSQDMVFPRDLNLFFDRFSEPMAQPFTRSQLSEKLRRLRTKFRIISARIDRGQDPSRLAPHDRDILHLCTRLWHPSHAASSPFSSPEAGGGTNKRRRRNPRPLATAGPASLPALPAPPLTSSPDDKQIVFHQDAAAGAAAAADQDEEEGAPPPPPISPVAANGAGVDRVGEAMVLPVKVDEAPVEGPGHEMVKKIILDVFDQCVKEARLGLDGQETKGDELAKRWREQQALELDVMSRRLRMVLEHAGGP